MPKKTTTKFGRNRIRRRINFREPVQKFLIICEGTKTEPNYFNGFKVPKDIKTIDVRGIGKNTIDLVKEAIIIRKKCDYDQVWVIFDVDDFPHEFITESLIMAESNRIRVACSNRAFEIWYLLHFHFFQTAMTRDQYQQKLSKLLKHPYEKNSLGIYDELNYLQKNAIKNSKKLVDLYNPHNPAVDNPSTDVYLLVEELNRFTPESRK